MKTGEQYENWTTGARVTITGIIEKEHRYKTDTGLIKYKNRKYVEYSKEFATPSQRSSLDEYVVAGKKDNIKPIEVFEKTYIKI